MSLTEFIQGILSVRLKVKIVWFHCAGGGWVRCGKLFSVFYTFIFNYRHRNGSEGSSEQAGSSIKRSDQRNTTLRSGAKIQIINHSCILVGFMVRFISLRSKFEVNHQITTNVPPNHKLHWKAQSKTVCFPSQRFGWHNWLTDDIKIKVWLPSGGLEVPYTNT